MVRGLQWVTWFYSNVVQVNSISRVLCLFSFALNKLTPCPPYRSLLLCGKHKVSIIVPLFFRVTVPGGCHSQGCQGYHTCRLLYSVVPPSYQASSPSSSIVKMSLNDCLKGLCHGSSVHFASFCQLFALNRYET